MKNDNKIVELGTDMLVKQGAFIPGLSRSGMKMSSLKREVSRVATIQKRHEKPMLRPLGFVDDDVPKFDRLMDIGHLKDESIVLNKHH